MIASENSRVYVVGMFEYFGVSDELGWFLVLGIPAMFIYFALKPIPKATNQN